MSIVLGFSCSTEEEKLTVTSSNSKESFFNELNAFNNNYQTSVIDKQIKDASLESKSCDWWCQFGRVVVVAAADIGGAAAGVKAGAGIAVGLGAATGGTGAIVVAGGAGLIMGAAASIGAAQAVQEVRLDPDPNFGTHGFIGSEEDIFIGKIESPEELVKQHNLLVASYYEKQKTLSKSGLRNSEELSVYNSLVEDVFVAEANEELLAVKNVLESDEFKAVNQGIEASVIKYRESGYDQNVFLSDLTNKGYINEDMNMVLTYFFNIYLNSENITNVDQISAHYEEAVNRSNLSKLDKEALISAFSVAKSSPEFWRNQN